MTSALHYKVSIKERVRGEWTLAAAQSETVPKQGGIIHMGADCVINA